MKSRATRKFWELYANLPADVRILADKAYELWQIYPASPGLYFKRVDPEDPIYSVRVGRNYRALGILWDDTSVWFWIGKHDKYDRMLK